MQWLMGKRIRGCLSKYVLFCDVFHLFIYVTRQTEFVYVYLLCFSFVTGSTIMRNKSGHVNAGKTTSKFVGVIFH